MNAARIAGAAALVLALGAAQAQDATTTPYQDQKAVEKSDAPKGPSSKAEAARANTARQPSESTDTTQQPMKPAPQAQASTESARGAAPGASRNVASASSRGGAALARLAKLEDFDKNKDGSISKEEAPANDALGMNFASYDKDGDGRISKQEFAQYKNGNRQLASNKPAKGKQEPKSEQQ